MLLRISPEICGRLGNPPEGRVEVKSRKGASMQTEERQQETTKAEEEEMCCDGSGRTVEQHRKESPDGKCCVDG